MLDQVLTLVSQYEEIFILVGIVSAVVFVATLLLTPYLLGLIPADYFSANYAYQVKRKTLLCLLKTTVKTFVGVLLVLAGIIMLVTPGQG
ncbi:MAG: hypothetical protein HOF80_00250, partial [Candidatus Thioglobus sp.]|nr:hypothetical protein [Candidatus Thioglobus sp.]